MGDQNTPLTETAARHLIRRTGFGIPFKESKKFRIASLVGPPALTRGEAADRLLDFRPKGFRPKSSSARGAKSKWIKFMLKAKKGFALGEKLTLFWHDHFATNFATLAAMGGESDAVRLLADQNFTLRKRGWDGFKDLCKAINVDPAMMRFLDTVRNFKGEPNENYARELLELFTLGVTDLNGNDNYLEPDIAQIARAFTGWTFPSNTLRVHLWEPEHDFGAAFPERGAKEIFGVAHPTQGHVIGGFAGPQPFTVGGEGANEIDEVIEIVFDHRDSDGQHTVARHLTWKLVHFFAHPLSPKPLPQAEKDVIDEIIADADFTTPGHPNQWSVRALMRALLVHDTFYETADAPEVAPVKSVKWPIDFVLGVLRSLHMRPRGRELQLQGGAFSELGEILPLMGFDVLDPPSVFGWDWEEAWISSAALLARYQFVVDVTSSRFAKAFKPRKLSRLDFRAPQPAEAIVDDTLEVLGVPDQFTESEKDALVDYLGGPGAVLDLDDFAVRNEKLHGLYALVLQSPTYQLH